MSVTRDMQESCSNMHFIMNCVERSKKWMHFSAEDDRIKKYNSLST